MAAPCGSKISPRPYLSIAGLWAKRGNLPVYGMVTYSLEFGEYRSLLGHGSVISTIAMGLPMSQAWICLDDVGNGPHNLSRH